MTGFRVALGRAQAIMGVTLGPDPPSARSIGRMASGLASAGMTAGSWKSWRHLVPRPYIKQAQPCRATGWAMAAGLDYVKN